MLMTWMMWLCVNGASAESKARGEQVNATALFNTVCVRYAVNISAICLPMNTHTHPHTHTIRLEIPPTILWIMAKTITSVCTYNTRVMLTLRYPDPQCLPHAEWISWITIIRTKRRRQGRYRGANFHLSNWMRTNPCVNHLYERVYTENFIFKSIL